MQSWDIKHLEVGFVRQFLFDLDDLIFAKIYDLTVIFSPSPYCEKKNTWSQVKRKFLAWLGIMLGC